MLNVHWAICPNMHELASYLRAIFWIVEGPKMNMKPQSAPESEFLAKDRRRANCLCKTLVAFLLMALFLSQITAPRARAQTSGSMKGMLQTRRERRYPHR